MTKIKELVSNLYSSLECIPIFGDTKIIDSRREPSNLLRMFQHSRFDETWTAGNAGGVSRCNTPNCKLCENIIETRGRYYSKNPNLFQSPFFRGPITSRFFFQPKPKLYCKLTPLSTQKITKNIIFKPKTIFRPIF